MAAAVVTDVDEQGRVVVFGQVAAVELGIAVAAHIRDVDVAHLAIRPLVYIAPVGLDPLAVTRRTFLGERLDRNGIHLATFRRFDGQLHIVVGLVDQQFLRAAFWPQALPVDGEYRVSLGHVQPWQGQRRGFLAVGWVAAYDTGDAVAILFRVIAPIHAQEALRVVRALAIFTAALVGVGGAEFALQLPEEVG